MSSLTPASTTVNDLCQEALRESGAIGVGQRPSAEDFTGAWTRLQWMLQSWERERFLVYHLVELLAVSNGAKTYTVGPGGNFDTSAHLSPFGPQFGPQFGAGLSSSVRPDRIESAFLRQSAGSSSSPVDFPLNQIPSREDYNEVALKELKSFPGAFFYDPAWPLGQLYVYPVAQAGLYSIGIAVKENLPSQFLSPASVIALPYEYYEAILYNLALRLRPRYGLGTWPGDPVPALAKAALAKLRGANTAIKNLRMDPRLRRRGGYNIFSDQVG